MSKFNIVILIQRKIEKLSFSVKKKRVKIKQKGKSKIFYNLLDILIIFIFSEKVNFIWEY